MNETSVFNVEATLTEYYTDALNALPRPDWLSTVNIVTDWAEIPASLPAISLYHLPGYRWKHFQGDRGAPGEKVLDAYGILEIDLWVSRSQLWQGQEIWQARLRYLQSMVEDVHTAESLVVIKDFSTAMYYPQATPYRVVIGDISVVQTAKDENPDIERRRALVNYSWHMRRAET